MEKENYKLLIDDSHDESDEQVIRGLIGKRREEGMKPVKGELEKTEEQLKIIEVVNKWIKTEMQAVGVEIFVPILPSQVHIFSEEQFDQQFSDTESEGFYSTRANAIYVRGDN